MGFRVFGSAEVLSVHVGADPQAAHVRKQAHRAVFSYVPREGYVYVRSRAISSRCNDNFDYFGAEEIEKSYLTFIGKPVFVNHHNSDHKQARGVIKDAALHRDRNPNGTPDTWVEVLMEVDAVTYPKLAKALVSGDIDRTSMGCDVQISKCSACGKEAKNPLEYCRHIPSLKGQYIHVLDRKTGAHRPQLVFEICSGLSFFENSLLVEPPADPTAFFLDKPVIGAGLDHLAAFAKAARLQEAAVEPGPAPSAPARISLTPAAQQLVRTASRPVTAAPKEPAPKKVSKADQFLVDNPPDPQNLVAMFHQAKPHQKAEGMDWYAHMHRTARMITGGQVQGDHVHGGDPALGAGLLANYSQQSSLSDNHWKASKSVLAGKGLWSGNNPGMFAGQEQANKADRMLAGEHHSQVLGAPKTRNFAHLIEHGGDDGTGHTAVCVDRHALSAAVGHRVNDEEFAQANLSAAPSAADKKAGHTEGHRYRLVADSYRAAADQLSRESGQHIAPHHVQAVTWVVQRDQNDEAERKETDPNRKKLIKGRITKNKNETARWYGHVEQHYPQFHQTQEHWKMTKLQQPSVIINGGYYLPRPGESPQERQQRMAINRRLAYNETKAPTDVDTLRDESCPICGNDIVFNGSECQVCGFIQPPQGLGDPDVDKAKQLDQLKQNIEDERNDSGLDPSQKGADFDAGDPDNTLPGGDNSANPWLSCPSCGTDIRPTAPQTAPTDGAQAAPGGPAEGEPCPVCGEGPLMSSGVSEDDTDEEAEQEQDQDGDGVPDEEEDEAEEPDADPDADDDEDDQKKNPTKNPAKRVSAAAKYRDHSKEFPMQNGFASLAKLNEQVARQEQYIAAQHRQLQRQGSQIQRLSASLTVVARLLGPQADEAMRRAAFLKRADEQNPAQPIPEPAPQPPSQTTVQAETPEAFADVRAPGMVPGVNNDVAADAVTTTYTPGQDIGTPPLRQLVDVTAPVEGTQGPRPISETKTNVDVRAGNPMNPQVAYPLGGDFAQAQRTGAAAPQDDLRIMASLRLARLRIQHGIEVGDDLVIGQKIANDITMSMPRINDEISTLNNVQKAAASVPMPPRNAVPRPAAPPQRIVPPLGQAGGFQTVASGRQQEDAELMAALL